MFRFVDRLGLGVRVSGICAGVGCAGLWVGIVGIVG